MRKIVLNLAISLDGYICDNEGGFDWIVGHGDNTLNTKEQFDYEKFLQSVDTVVMGSVAYEDCVLSGLSTYEGKKVVVATTRNLEVKGDVDFVNSGICEKVLELKKENSDKDIWLFGGASLTDEFIKKNLVDEYIIAIIPTILGNGRRLFKGDYPKIDLHLKNTTIGDGITILTYNKK